MQYGSRTKCSSLLLNFHLYLAGITWLCCCGTLPGTHNTYTTPTSKKRKKKTELRGFTRAHVPDCFLAGSTNFLHSSIKQDLCTCSHKGQKIPTVCTYTYTDTHPSHPPDASVGEKRKYCAGTLSFQRHFPSGCLPFVRFCASLTLSFSVW